jgi:predicted nucleotidyltransferase
MNFETAVQALSDARVEFIIIGGWSAILHGSAHLTNDLDIFFSRNSGNLKHLVKALQPYHPRPRDMPKGLPFVWDPVTLASSTILTWQTDLGAIGLLAEVTGLASFEEVSEASLMVDAFGRRVRTLDLESLIRSKRALRRAKDANVLLELESLLEAAEPD